MKGFESTGGFQNDSYYTNLNNSNDNLQKKKIITIQMNNQPKIIFFNIITGLFIMALQVAEELTREKTKLKSLAICFSLLFVYIIVSFARKKCLPKPKFSHFCISILYLATFYLTTFNFNQMHLYYAINSVLLFFISLCFDKRNSFRCTHFFSCIIIIFGVILWFEYTLNSVSNFFIKDNLKPLIFVFSASFCYALSFIFQQNCLGSPIEVYNYIHLQSVIGILIFSGLFALNKEYKNLPIGLSDILYFLFNVISLCFLFLLIPFYSKKNHPIATTLFSYAKYSFVLFKSFQLYEILIGNMILFLFIVVFFYKKLVNSKKIKKIPDLDFNNISRISLENDVEDSKEGSYGIDNLLLDQTNSSFDNNSEKVQDFYRRNSLNSINKYFL